MDIGDKLYQPCSLDIIEHKVISIHQYEYKMETLQKVKARLAELRADETSLTEDWVEAIQPCVGMALQANPEWSGSDLVVKIHTIEGLTLFGVLVRTGDTATVRSDYDTELWEFDDDPREFIRWTEIPTELFHERYNEALALIADRVK